MNRLFHAAVNHQSRGLGSGDVFYSVRRQEQGRALRGCGLNMRRAYEQAELKRRVSKNDGSYADSFPISVRPHPGNALGKGH